MPDFFTTNTTDQGRIFTLAGCNASEPRHLPGPGGLTLTTLYCDNRGVFGTFDMCRKPTSNPSQNAHMATWTSVRRHRTALCLLRCEPYFQGTGAPRDEKNPPERSQTFDVFDSLSGTVEGSTPSGTRLTPTCDSPETRESGLGNSLRNRRTSHGFFKSGTLVR